MPRAQRLLDLLQMLRLHRYPVTGAALAGELGISLRTLYRDIDALQQQGAQIEGAAGLGYRLRPGFTLPPLMFSEDEIEALVLGSRWVAGRGDERLASSARHALAKIAAVLPAPLRVTLDDTALLVGPGASREAGDTHLPAIRLAIRSERKLQLRYCDLKGDESERLVWPFALGFFEQTRVVVAWCELRQGFRHFRADRIRALTPCVQRYPGRRQALLKAWRESQGIAAQ